MKKFIICLLGLTVLTVGVEAKSYSRSSSRSYSRSSRSYKSSTRTKSSITSIKPKATSTHRLVYPVLTAQNLSVYAS